MGIVKFMRFKSKIFRIKGVFKELQRKAKLLKKGLKISCPDGCGYCCCNEDIYASVAEFLPLAYSVLSDKNRKSFLEILNKSEDQGLCVFFEQHDNDKRKARCLIYDDRGLICRLFGYAYIFDKYGKKAFSTCGTIKEIYPGIVEKANEHAESSKTVPVIIQYYQKIFDLFPEYGADLYPVNKAMKFAIDKVSYILKDKK
jgi:uncharacterized protein